MEDTLACILLFYAVVKEWEQSSSDVLRTQRGPDLKPPRIYSARKPYSAVSPFSSVKATPLTTMDSLHLFTLDVVIDTPRYANGQPLKMAARRYSTKAAPSGGEITLLFIHGTGNRTSFIRL